MRCVCPIFLVFFYVICRLTDRPVTRHGGVCRVADHAAYPARCSGLAQLHMPSRGSHQLQPV